MTLAEFKKSYGLTSLNLYQSSKSSRLVGNFSHNGAEHKIATTETFDSNSPIFVYPTDVVDTDSGEITKMYILSNKTATPALTL